MTGKDQANAKQTPDAQSDEPEDVVDPAAREAAEKAVEEALREAEAEMAAEAGGEAPADAGAGEAAAEGGAPSAALEALKQENAELRDKMMRAVADAENTKRRAEKEAADARKYGAAGLVKEILPAVDNLRRAVESVPEAIKAENETVRNLAVGVEMTEKQILDAFEKAGIRKLDPKGEKFSYERHQAISEATGTGQPPGTIVDVLQSGYMLHDRLLRAAMVVVAKGEPEAKSDGGDEGVDTTA